ncbi:uncharacterized protein LACBIDRAFT_313152 [Laccaria bicolor S238N-H82]|uniref:Predicted protein n=1 Tax=Laccaria bicolor (strain S238N-H82 / ATCC MYA-4686) TaxID=486041 RepID=B0DXN1_LACBS|nr:uncharacterized protein LACBIDRAFT_313152 [Laccaria bicolor S238N-H82]EDR00644.1 predicted protein [Laccaria bicolor S238N-H82]|eukprot:XP_001888653.1 predicted protein [Laccaria bicolor S238N-H82]
MLPSFCLPHVSTHVDVPDAGQLIILIDSEPVSRCFYSPSGRREVVSAIDQLTSTARLEYLRTFLALFLTALLLSLGKKKNISWTVYNSH